ncbi:His-Xaa-Ser system protein HxsD [Leptospira sp. 'Mane']|uniref:His-Xaa-Ser system protein HxsD n=1 Tax=Leptospira sp. 'Mane' TaxID=3387407 RepID=UPI00398AC323
MEDQKLVSCHSLSLIFDSSIYSKDAIFKALYSYGNKAVISVSKINDNFQVNLEVSEKKTQEELKKLSDSILRDVHDFSVREIANNETKNIRELLIAKAFSNGELDELPVGFVADPVGFNIESIADEC